MTDQVTPEGPQEATGGRESASTRESEDRDVQAATDAAERRTALPSVDEVREHVTGIHLMGMQLDTMRDQLDEVENWFWHHLADLREQQPTPSAVPATTSDNPEDTLRAQVRAALRAARISQVAVADRLGISQKHLSQMLTGRAVLTLPWAERIAALCGMRVAVGLEPTTSGGSDA